MSWWNSKKQEPESSSSKPLVIMVDDEQELCVIMGVALVAEGFDFASRNDGESGLELIRERRPQVAILDIKMPKLNGYQVLATMQQDPELCNIPVIVMTGMTEETDTSDEEWARKLGVRRFISKPVTPEKIIEAVQAELNAPDSEG